MKKKYKVIQKVKEHNRKKAKEAKKLRLSGKNKVEKDPGIPNNWPFKEHELKALEARRTKAIKELEQKKAERKERVIVLSLFNSHFLNYFYRWLIMFIMICYVSFDVFILSDFPSSCSFSFLERE